jgi:hypothetical protein
MKSKEKNMSRKIIITTVLAGFFLIATAALFADDFDERPFRGGPQNEEPMHRGGGFRSNPGQYMGPGMRGADIGVLGQIAGIDEIQRKYHLQIQRVFLDAKQEALGLYEEQQNLREKFFDLLDQYEKSSVKDRREIIDAIKQLRENQSKIQVIQERSMEKINALYQEQKKEMEKALDTEINKLGANAEEMDKFVEMIKQRWPYDFPPPRRSGRKM